MARLGAHLSAAGGPSRAVAAASRLGCRSLQLFLRAPGRWQGAAPSSDEVERFRNDADRSGLVGACFAHAPYLLNLASADEDLRRRSLGLAGVVLHPGSAGLNDRGEAEARCRDAIAESVEVAGPGAAVLLLEGTAGMGGQLGRTPGELAALVAAGTRVGVCLDTAHLWGAGYDLLGGGWRRVCEEMGAAWGREVPDLVHGNDTPVELGSHRDRHAPPGDGRLGEKFFRELLADERLADTPVVLEIPPGEGDALVARALARLRAWSAGGRRRRARKGG
jgi:deoxyribonuclease-4